MDKEIKTTKTVEVETITHKFYCDECGVLLGESREDPDGYYEEIRKYEWELRVGLCEYLIKKGHYCSKCKEQIVSALEGIGFKKENYLGGKNG